MEQIIERPNIFLAEQKNITDNKKSEIKSENQIKKELAYLSEFDEMFQEKMEELAQKEKEYSLQELRAVTFLANKYIKEHNEQLGVNSYDFPIENIMWMNNDNKNKNLFSSQTVGNYNDFEQKIEIKRFADVPRLEIIIHELIHFQSSAKNQKNVADFSKRISRIGFNSFWLFPHREGEGKIKNVLSGLDEAITEKISDEIYQQKKDFLLSDLQKDYSEIEKISDEISMQIKNLRLAKINLMNKVGEKVWLEYVKEDQDVLNDYHKFGGFEGVKKYYYEYTVKDFSENKNNFVGNSYLGDKKDKTSYFEEIKVLDFILDKLAQNSLKNKNISFEEVKKEEWQNLQKAFFAGNTLYLKKIESVLGRGFLREFDKIVNEKKENNEAEYYKKISEFLNKIN
ncbi:MAG: hypothetical protein WC414_01115 [Patescibacteria group bacterium]